MGSEMCIRDRNTNSFHSLTKSSQPPNLHISTTSYLFNFLAALALHLSSLAGPPTSSALRITDRSFRCASPCLWNQLPSLRQPHFNPSVSVLPVHAPYHIFSLCQLTTLTIHNSLSLSLLAQDLPLYRQHCAQRKATVFNLLRGRF